MPGVRRRDRRAEQQTGSITLAIRFWPMPQCKAIEALFVCRKKHCTNTSMLVRHSLAFGWIIPAMPKNPKFSLSFSTFFRPRSPWILSKARVATPLICARADWRRAYRHSRWVFGRSNDHRKITKDSGPRVKLIQAKSRRSSSYNRSVICEV